MGTSDYFREHGVDVEPIQWNFENVGEDTTKAGLAGQMYSMAEFLANQHFHMVVNVPMRTGGARRVSSFVPTYGYRYVRYALGVAVKFCKVFPRSSQCCFYIYLNTSI